MTGHDAAAEPVAPDPAAAGGFRLLDPRYIPLQRQVGRIVAGVMSVMLLAALLLLSAVHWPWLLLIWMVIAVLLAWHAHRWPAIEYRHTGYRIDEQGLEIRTGVVWRRVINVPRSRVQHTDVVQGPLERRHGLGRLVVYTAGTEHSRVELPGLEHATAMALRDHLLPREGGDAV